MKNFLFVIMILMILTSCGLSNFSRENNWTGDQKKEIRTVESENNDVKVDVLTVIHDKENNIDIIVYRFIDAGHTRYVAENINTKEMLEVKSSTETSSGKSKNSEDDTVFTTK